MTDRTSIRPLRSAASKPEVSRLDVLDCASLFDAVDVLRQYVASSAQLSHSTGTIAPNFDYRECFRALAEARDKLKFQPCQNTLAIATIDFESEGQGRFVNALTRMDILVEAIDFRNASVTMPLASDGEPLGSRHVTSLGSNIAYVLGLLATRPSPEVIIVTRCFEIYEPLRDFVENRKGKAAIAFFRRFLDARFGIAGLFDPDSPISFIDLEPESTRLVGIDVREITSARRPTKARGISGL